MVYSNDPVVLTVKEKNDGDVSLTSPYVMLDSTKLEKNSPEYFGGDTIIRRHGVGVLHLLYIYRGSEKAISTPCIGVFIALEFPSQAAKALSR